MIEKSLLKVLSVRENYDKYSSFINPVYLSSQSKFFLLQYKKYYDLYKDKFHIDFGELSELIFLENKNTMSEDVISEYKDLLNSINTIDLDSLSCEKVVFEFERSELYVDLSEDLNNNIDFNHLENKIEVFKNKFKSLSDDEIELKFMDIESALIEEDRTKGLKFTVNSLTEYFNGGIIKGDTILVVGYTNNGKTAFTISQAAYMATQLPPGSPVLYFNTERSYKKILNRAYCSVLNTNLDILTKYKDKAIVKYKELMGGDPNKLQIIDSKGWHVKKIQEWIEKLKPGLIVFDTLDHFKGFEKYLNKDGMGDRNLQLYSWATEISMNFAPVFITSQSNREGHNEMYTPLTAIRGSGVDKQSQADTVIFIGALEGENGIRYISVPKNKLGKDSAWRCQVKFDQNKTRFED